MALPTYDKSKRRKNFEHLPKGAYVVKILGAKEETGNYGQQVAIYFDIAEGEHRDFYNKQYESNTSEDKVWPYDAVFYLTVPTDGCADWIWTKWNTFFGDLEDSNKGYIFDGDVKKLKGKLIGGKFHNKQTEYNGNVYDHTKLKWTCVAEDVRKGKAGKMPNDALVGGSRSNRNTPAASGNSEMDGFVNLPEGAEEELPF